MTSKYNSKICPDNTGELIKYVSKRSLFSKAKAIDTHINHVDMKNIWISKI